MLQNHRVWPGALIPLLVLSAPWAGLGQDDSKLQFEVASIRPSAPPGTGRMTVGCHGGPGTDDPTLLVCQNWDLANLTSIAYRLDFFHISAPDWMHTARFDIRATIPAGTTKEQFGAMWQNLLADRFKLKVHRETRESQTFDLVVAKGGPKFRPSAVPNGKSAMPDRGPVRLDSDGYPSFGPGHPGIGFRSGRARIYFPDMTVQQLAMQMSGPLQAPVTDSTGLPGKYEISLYWASGAVLESSPDAGPRLMDALRDQLGLRLESKKGPTEFLVVDHAERFPTDN